MTKLNIYILLDQSGSMSMNWVETLGSINGYVDGLRGKETDAMISVVAFDDVEPFKVVRDKVTVAGYSNLTAKEVSPRGMTPLFDATGKALVEAEKINAEKTVLLIMTDGMENASREYSKEAITKAIKSAEAKGWEVIFLGQNFDASVYTQAFQMDASKFANTSGANMGARMDQMANTTMAYASGTRGMSFTEEEKNEVK